MEKLKLFPILLILLSASTNAQINWYWQNPFPQGNNLADIEILDSNTIISCGSKGTIIRSTDKGESWQTSFKVNGINEDFRAMFFINKSTGWAGSNAGVIIKSTNGGMNWTVQNNSISNLIYDIFFIDSLKGYCTSNLGGMYKTTNGGINWTISNTGMNGSVNSLFFINDSIGWGCGYSFLNGLIIKTTNGGENWFYQESGHSLGLSSITFINENTGWIVGNSDVFMKTSNGGVNWSAVSISGNSTDFLNDVSFIDVNTGIAVGNNGRIIKTTDNGANWNQIQAEFQDQFISISGIKNGDVYISGFAGRVLRSENAGDNWTALSSGNSKNIRKINMSEGILYTVGSSGTILKSTDRGSSWIQQNSNITRDLTNSFFLNSNSGFACGSNGKILKTTNGGNQWDDISVNNSTTFYSVFFINENTGIVSGDATRIYKTTNGGVNWSDNSHPTGGAGRAMYFLNSQIGWIVGNSCLKTTDGGDNWLRYSINIGSFLNDVFFKDESIGWTVADDGLYTTSNGGENWINVNIPNDSVKNYYKMDFRDPNNRWILSRSNRLLRSRDNGGEWEIFEVRSSPITNSFILTDNDTLWIAGENGSIQMGILSGPTLINIGNQPVEKSNYKLFQNYPNPFNPNTIISFQLYKSSVVELSVYDITGKKIHVITNESLNHGTYNYNWNGGEFSSGIYFYQLKVIGEVNSVQSKSMLLMK